MKSHNIEISIQGGYIKHKDIFVSPEEANHLPDDKICILCTGTQGEPLAALSRLASGTHKHIKLRSDDIVVFSSSAIPGNALSISRTINKLYLKGITVYTNTSLSDIHASGHGNEEELKWMIRLINPKYFMPFHGEYRMLKKHADIAVSCDIPSENTFVLSNGEVLSMKNGVIKKAGYVPAGDSYVDGNRVGEVCGTGSLVNLCCDISLSVIVQRHVECVYFVAVEDSIILILISNCFAYRIGLRCLYRQTILIQFFCWFK